MDQMLSNPAPPRLHSPVQGDGSSNEHAHTTAIDPPAGGNRSPQELINQIKDFLENGYYLDSRDLVIPDIYASEYEIFRQELDHPRCLTGKEVDSLRYGYNPETATLTIHCARTPAQAAVTSLLSDMCSEFTRGGFLTKEEAKCVSTNFGTDVVIPYLRRRHSGRKRSAATAIKQPDAALTFADRTSSGWRGGRFPTVVFVVALSQPYEDAVEDARQWLVGTRGGVKLVILVKLSEGEKEPGEDPTPTYSAEFDTARGFEKFFGDTSQHGKWVGPISGFIELYRYDKDTKSIYIDGPRVDLPPSSAASSPTREGPSIKISDLLPATHFTGDGERSFPIPLHDYRSLIDDGVMRLALNRKAAFNEQLWEKEFGGKEAEAEDRGQETETGG